MVPSMIPFNAMIIMFSNVCFKERFDNFLSVHALHLSDVKLHWIFRSDNNSQGRLPDFGVKKKRGGGVLD